jgi:hypothetical protein
VLPHCKYITLATLKNIISLAENGASVIMAGGPPAGISGYHNLQENNKSFGDLINRLANAKSTKVASEIKIGKGNVIMGSDLEKLLEHAAVRRETLVERGLHFLRKRTDDGKTLYFVSNGDAPFEGWVSFQTTDEASILYNPMTGDVGLGDTRKSGNTMAVYLQLKSNETIFVETRSKKAEDSMFPYVRTVGTPLQLNGPWTLTFTEGGPELPAVGQLDVLSPWTALRDAQYQSFSGSATYRLSFARPAQKASRWLLDLGTVKESAEVMINGKSLGVLIGPAFQVQIDDALLTKENVLEVKVCNLMANRIASMDQHKIFWKKFYNVNFPARKAENRRNNIFDASGWKPRASGLLGPVRLSATENVGKMGNR